MTKKGKSGEWSNGKCGNDYWSNGSKRRVRNLIDQKASWKLAIQALVQTVAFRSRNSTTPLITSVFSTHRLRLIVMLCAASQFIKAQERLREGGRQKMQEFASSYHDVSGPGRAAQHSPPFSAIAFFFACRCTRRHLQVVTFQQIQVNQLRSTSSAQTLMEARGVLQWRSSP